MSEEYFYHYTTINAAKDIFLSGIIYPSEKNNNRDAIHGDGVYLTTLEPRLGREVVQKNNWDGMRDKNVDVCFELLMPSIRVKRVKEKRVIQIHQGPILLSDYKWTLKNWDGELLATQHFMVCSRGGAAQEHPEKMGRYALFKRIVVDGHCPVYKHETQDYFLYRDSRGDWSVGDIVGDSKCWLQQESSDEEVDRSPSPPKTVSWLYVDLGGFREDVTLRVYPCY